MTRDEVIAMARDAGFAISDSATDEAVERFRALIDAAAASEREALYSLKADALDIFNNPPELTSQDVRDVIEWYDAAIRARGEK